ncbi:MAG: hypothetical protein LBV03_05915 [Fusobacteriales bacterium]|jgi:hypothetical protein|nr:hypothetical protein [Fusobacteriales bacterium]
MISIGLVFKDIFLIYGKFKNIYFKIIDISTTLFVPVLNIMIILAMTAISSNKKIEIDGLTIFLIFLSIFSILKLIYVYIIKNKFYLKVFYSIF